MEPKDITDRLSEGDIATLLNPEKNDFWCQITPVLTLIPGDLQDKRYFKHTDMSNRFAIVTKRADIPARGIHGMEETHYCVEIYDKGVQRDTIGAPLAGENHLFALRDEKTFVDAMQTHYNALRHLKEGGY
ncbi:MAG: hypothetical protein MUF61_03450 [archaeon]|nr:hypothetical protein [archaeon]